MKHENAIYVLDLVLAVPTLWLVFWLFSGAVTLKGVTLRIGWPWCWIGLATVTTIALRLAGVIA